jgi:hypothetical protein
LDPVTAVAAWICVRCGVQYPDTATPPASCPICEDERECVAAGGQRWTTADELARDHSVEIREEEPGLVGLGVTPSFAIGQRALLVRTPHGNVLWDCIPLLDEPTRRTLDRWGGVSAVCVSHPHFYGALVDVADGWWDHVVRDGGAAVVRRSADRYVRRLGPGDPSP